MSVSNVTSFKKEVIFSLVPATLSMVSLETEEENSAVLVSSLAKWHNTHTESLLREPLIRLGLCTKSPRWYDLMKQTSKKF